MGKALCSLLMIVVLSGAVTVYAENRNEPGNTESAIDVAKAGSKICPYCGEENLPDAVWCWKCGKELPQEKAGQMYCPYCGARISSEAIYCPKCGRAVTKDQPTRTKRYRRRGRGPTGQSGLGVGLGAAFGGGSTALNANVSFDFGIGDYVALGPVVHIGTAFNDLGVAFGGGVGTRFYPIPYFDSPLQPFVSVAFGYARGKAFTNLGNTIGANTIAADFGFGTDFEIPGSIVVPFMGGAGGVNHVWASGYGSATEGVFAIGGGVRFAVW